MAEYIERNIAVTIADYADDEHPYDKDPKIPETYSDYNQGWSAACDYIRSRLEGTPPADVAPVRYGRWEMQIDNVFVPYRLKCSECDWFTIDLSVNEKYHYCPNCGAKMDDGDPAAEMEGHRVRENQPGGGGDGWITSS